MVLRRTLPSRLTGAPPPEGDDVAARVVKPAEAIPPATTAATSQPQPAAAPNAVQIQAAALAAATANAFAPQTPQVLEALPAAPRVLEESFAPPAATPVSITPTPELPAAMSAPSATPSTPPSAPPAITDAAALEPVSESVSEPVSEPVSTAPEAALPALPALPSAAPDAQPQPQASATPEPQHPTVPATTAPPASTSPEVEAAPDTSPASARPEGNATNQKDSVPSPQSNGQNLSQDQGKNSGPNNPQNNRQNSSPNQPNSGPNPGQLRRRVGNTMGQGPNLAAAKTPVQVQTTPTQPAQTQAKTKSEAQPTPTPAPRIILPTVEKPAPTLVQPLKAEAKVENSSTPTATPAPEDATEAPRKTRTVQARDFAAATIEATTPAGAPAPALTLAPEVPVDTRPLDKVDEELIASGIMHTPQGDSLTSAVPGGFGMQVEETAASAGGGDYRLATGNIPVSSVSLNSAGGLPWQTEPLGSGGWQLDAPMPPPDVFKPQQGPSSSASFGTENASTRVPPPTLPDIRPSRYAMNASARGRSSWLGTGITAVALGAVGFFVWNQYGQTGGLEQAKQQLAQFAEPGPRVAELAGVSSTTGALLPPPNVLPQGTPTGATEIGFLEAAPDPNAPIAADTDTTMPEDISLFAQMQRAIQEQREKTAANTSPSALLPEMTADADPSTPANDTLTKEQVAAELAAYTKALNENPDNPPRPREFFRDPAAFMDGNAAPLPQDTLLPPPATSGTRAIAQNDGVLPPPAELYSNNPNNLPILGEPVGAQAPRIRQLQDFAAELMVPDERRVKIPQGVRPRLAATDFPSLDVLSFVPGKGVVATADGREGVLLIGESINGWELTQVTGDLAEFRAGGRSYYVSAQN